MTVCHILISDHKVQMIWPHRQEKTVQCSSKGCIMNTVKRDKVLTVLFLLYLAYTRLGRYFIRAMARRTLINGQSFVLKAKPGFYLI